MSNHNKHTKKSVPTVGFVAGRRYIREVLESVKGYGLTEAKLKELVEGLASPIEVDWSALREWIEFNHSKDYIRREHDDDLEENLWFITKAGIAKGKI